MYDSRSTVLKETLQEFLFPIELLITGHLAIQTIAMRVIHSAVTTVTHKLFQRSHFDLMKLPFLFSELSFRFSQILSGLVERWIETDCLAIRCDRVLPSF